MLPLNSIKVFSGNSNRDLSEEIASKIGISISSANVERFSDGESCVMINETVRGVDVFVIQPTSTPVNENFMELIIMIDALHRASAGRITAVMPYFGYARQDKKSKSREPITAKLISNMITIAGADRVLTMDLHASQIQGFFDIPVDNLAGIHIMSEYFKNKFNFDDNIVVVSPDMGGVQRVRKLAKHLGENVPIAIIDKRRPKPNECEVMNVVGDVYDKKVIIYDDMIDTAGTVIKASKALLEIHKAKEVYVAATHGVLSGSALERVYDSDIKELVLLNTIKINKSSNDKIKQLSVSDIFADAIIRINENKSISPLF